MGLRPHLAHGGLVARDDLPEQGGEDATALLDEEVCHRERVPPERGVEAAHHVGHAVPGIALEQVATKRLVVGGVVGQPDATRDVVAAEVRHREDGLASCVR